VVDGHGDTATGTETIVVSINEPAPTATAGTVSTDEDTIITNGKLTFASGDADDQATLTAATLGTHTTADGAASHQCRRQLHLRSDACCQL